MSNSKEIIKKAIEFNKPERIGLDFNAPHFSDFSGLGFPLVHRGWGNHEDLRQEVPWFHGQVMRDPFGNIWGRLENISKGETIKGVLEGGWGSLKGYSMPVIDKQWGISVQDQVANRKDKYVMGYLPGLPFSIMRTIRGMENFMMDVLLETDKVLELGEMVVSFLEEIIDQYEISGVDGIMIAEDWGTQSALLISPESWRTIFKPWFSRLSRKTHRGNMHMIMHSCGYIHDIIPDLIDVGVDVLQLDQPDLLGIERLSHEFGGKIGFYCPVDIQKVMQTGRRELIEAQARKMISLFGQAGGGFIAKDYPQWDAIDVKEEWAQWARDIFMEEG